MFSRPIVERDRLRVRREEEDKNEAKEGRGEGERARGERSVEDTLSEYAEKCSKGVLANGKMALRYRKTIRSNTRNRPPYMRKPKRKILGNLSMGVITCIGETLDKSRR